MARTIPAGPFERAHEIDLRRARGGQGSEHERGAHGDDRREEQDTRVERQVQHDRHRGRQPRRRQQARAPERDREPAGRAGQRQQQVLRQQLTHQPSTPGAERLPDRELHVAARRARQHEVRQVDADDEHDERDDGHQHSGKGGDRGRDLRMHHACCRTPSSPDRDPDRPAPAGSAGRSRPAPPGRARDRLPARDARPGACRPCPAARLRRARGAAAHRWRTAPTARHEAAPALP